MTLSEHRDELRAWLETAELCEKAGMRDAALACAQMASVAEEALTDALADVPESKPKKKSLAEHFDAPSSTSKPVRKAITRISDLKK